MFVIRKFGLRADINAHHTTDNWGPEIKIETESQLPSGEEYVYKKFVTEHGTMYVGKAGMFTRFYAYDKPGNGFGGAHINVRMEDGSEETLIGPWSSRAGVVNMLVPNTKEDQIAEISVNGMAMYISVDALETLVEQYFPNLEVEPMEKWGEETYWCLRGPEGYYRAFWEDGTYAEFNHHLDFTPETYYGEGQYEEYSMRDSKYWMPEIDEANALLHKSQGI